MSPAVPQRRGPLRIGDAERDQAVSSLSEHFVAGRLTQEEFEERSGQATRARYADDLAPLFADLPDGAEPVEALRWQPGQRPPYPVAHVAWAPVRVRPGPPPVFLFVLPLLMIGMVSAVALGAPWLLWGLFWFALMGRLFHHGRRHRLSRR